MNVPVNRLIEGSTEVGASADVLTAYRLIDEVGGLVIAPHVNSTHGVAMRGFNFGGQTKIAYTQVPHLHALEVTDMDVVGRRTTAKFFDGTKPEYPRRMHCIQGSTRTASCVIRETRLAPASATGSRRSCCPRYRSRR